MSQLTFLDPNSDFPLGTAWDGTDPNFMFENPGNHQHIKPTDLGGLRKPWELKKWKGNRNPVISFTDQRIDDILRGIGMGNGNTHSHSNPTTLH